MADTTVAKVKGIAKHLSKLDPEIVQMYIDDAKAELSDYAIPAKYQERLQRYLAVHLATLDIARPTNKKVSDLSASYNRVQGKNLDGTEYGQEYRRLLRKARGGQLLQVM